MATQTRQPGGRSANPGQQQPPSGQTPNRTPDQSVSQASARVPAPAATTARLRRNPRWIALGIVALCLGALGSFVLYNQLADARDVVAIRTSVSRGEPVTAAVLTVVRVGDTPGIGTVPAAQLDTLVGETATVDLTAGTLLAPGMIAPVVIPAAGHSLVGIKLDIGRSPNGFLRSGSPIRLIAVPPTGANATYQDAYSNLSIDATVVEANPTADGQAMLLDVDVAAGQAAQAATLAAASRLVAVRDPEH